MAKRRRLINATKSTISITSLPDELFGEILGFLDIVDVLRVQQTSSQCNIAARNFIHQCTQLDLQSDRITNRALRRITHRFVSLTQLRTGALPQCSRVYSILLEWTLSAQHRPLSIQIAGVCICPDLLLSPELKRLFNCPNPLLDDWSYTSGLHVAIATALVHCIRSLGLCYSILEQVWMLARTVTANTSLLQDSNLFVAILEALVTIILEYNGISVSPISVHCALAQVCIESRGTIDIHQYKLKLLRSHGLIFQDILCSLPRIKRRMHFSTAFAHSAGTNGIYTAFSFWNLNFRVLQLLFFICFIYKLILHLCIKSYLLGFPCAT